jgi:integrase
MKAELLTLGEDRVSTDRMRDTLRHLHSETIIGLEQARMREFDSPSTESSLELANQDTVLNPASQALPGIQRDALAKNSEMTIADFIEQKFVPGHVFLKKSSGRAHYQAMLRHVIKPEEVDRVFQVAPVRPDKKLMSSPDWPYLSDVRLCDAQPSHVENLIAAATEHGYSTQTIAHIRNTVNAMFSYAIQEDCLSGANPAKAVMLPPIVHKKPRSLSLIQLREILGEMHYPEREMAIVALLTPMTMVEICAMQWKYVNLSLSWSRPEDDPIPPRTIAVRKYWDRGEFGDVPKHRRRNLEIHDVLFEFLNTLQRRLDIIEPNRFLFADRAERAVNHIGVKSRRLKPLGKQRLMPELSWQVFHHTRTTMLSRFGTTFYDYLVDLSSAAPARRGFGAI